MNPSLFVNVTTNPDDPRSERQVVRYDQFVRRLLKADTPRMEALHIALGMCGEVGEWLNAKGYDNALEELGDLEFYWQAAHNHYEITRAEYEHLLPHITTFHTSPLVIAVGEFADVVKKEYVYGRPRAARHELLTLFACIDGIICHWHGIYEVTREHVIQLNASKLEIRYAGLTYSDAAAIARVDKLKGE